MEYKAASDCALLVRIASQITPAANRQVIGLFRKLHATQVPGVKSYSPSYVSLTIRFDPRITDHVTLQSIVQQAVNVEEGQESATTVTLHTLPVCYAGQYSPDLRDVAERLGLSVSDVIEIHSGQRWTVYFLGFLPGFAYMGDLPTHLHVPRKANPRPTVPGGSVAIAGRNTGIYPFAAAGGWNLIGCCPVPLFDRHRAQPSLLAPGDQVQFRPVSEAEFGEMAGSG